MSPHPARRERHPKPEPVDLKPSPPTIEETVQDGLRALDNQEYQNAARQFRSALKQAPFRSDLKELLSLALDRRTYSKAELHPEHFSPELVSSEPTGPLLGVKRRERRIVIARLVRPAVWSSAILAALLAAWGLMQWSHSDKTPPKRLLDSQEVTEMIAVARRYQEDGRYDEAVAELEETLRHDPADPQRLTSLIAEWRYKQGSIFSESQDYSKAIGCLREATDKEPENVPYLHQLGWALHMRGRSLALDDPGQAGEYAQEAREVFEKSLELDPAHIDSLHGLARVFLAQKDIESAAVPMRKLIEIAPLSREAISAKDELLARGLPISAP
jgi:tetratricopeptide (TPR) repeat protein